MEHTTALFEVPELEKFWPKRKSDMSIIKKEWHFTQWEGTPSASWQKMLTHSSA